MAIDRKEAQSGRSLRRALGRMTATFLTAAMIIGTGLFAALGVTAEKACSGLLLDIISAAWWRQTVIALGVVCSVLFASMPFWALLTGGRVLVLLRGVRWPALRHAT